MSCRVEAVEPRQTPVCANTDSDPDGDGWGWENGESCKVNSVGYQPGSDFNSAGLVPLDTQINGRLASVAVHYYKFLVEQHIAVALELNEDYQDDYLILDGDGQQYLGRYSFEDNTCLLPGEYYLILSKEFDFGFGPEDYSATLRTTDVNCSIPTSETENDQKYVLFPVDTGDVFYFDTEQNLLSKRSIDGTVVWEASIGSVDNVEPLIDGSVLVISWLAITRYDSLGQLVWSKYWSGNPYSYSIGNMALIYPENISLYSMDLNDGSMRWRYDSNHNDYYQSDKLVATQDGRVLVMTGNGVLLTFDQ